jgi:hypothetical protein
MEWTTPTPGLAEYAYSYPYDAAEAPAELPALWRCSCGFQIDSVAEPATARATA